LRSSGVASQTEKLLTERKRERSTLEGAAAGFAALGAALIEVRLYNVRGETR
jgi:hypothetical protein